jgi:L-threonylcarbamoyladenylate synthase
MELKQLQTKCWRVDAKKPERQIIQAAAQIIKTGGLVAFPTETVYGLGANALDSRAVRRLFQAKARPADNPLTLHVADLKTVFAYVKDIPQEAHALAGQFWPGPLTLVLPFQGHLPAEVTGGRPALGVRMPDHPVALALIEQSGVPLVAPSANLSGRPSPTTADHVLQDLSGRIEAVLDGGPSEWGLESTVIDFTGEKPVLLRPGVLTQEDLRPFTGSLELTNKAIPSAKYAHYTPHAAFLLVEGEDDRVVLEKIGQLALHYEKQGQKVGLLLYEEDAFLFQSYIYTTAGSKSRPVSVAAGLFQAMRELDNRCVDIIICAGFHGQGLGLAIQNRLRLAAGSNTIKV